MAKRVTQVTVLAPYQGAPKLRATQVVVLAAYPVNANTGLNLPAKRGFAVWIGS